LLEASAESGRQARRDLEFALDFAETSVRSPSMRARAKKKVSNYIRSSNTQPITKNPNSLRWH